MPEPEDPPVVAPPVEEPTPAPEQPRNPSGYVYVDETTGMMINTLHELERGAMVNAIYLATMGRVMPLANWTDQQVREVFDASVGQRGTIRPVFVELLG